MYLLLVNLSHSLCFPDWGTLESRADISSPQTCPVFNSHSTAGTGYSLQSKETPSDSPASPGTAPAEEWPAALACFLLESASLISPFVLCLWAIHTECSSSGSAVSAAAKLPVVPWLSQGQDFAHFLPRFSPVRRGTPLFFQTVYEKSTFSGKTAEESYCYPWIVKGNRFFLSVITPLLTSIGLQENLLLRDSFLSVFN